MIFSFTFSAITFIFTQPSAAYRRASSLPAVRTAGNEEPDQVSLGEESVNGAQESVLIAPRQVLDLLQAA